MSILTVRFGSTVVGRLAEIPAGVVFEYDPAFLSSGHELSPLHLPLGPGVRTRSSGGLPGLFDDSLPDRWGHRVMEEWFRQRGIAPHTLTPLRKLSFIGARGMGALTYEPVADGPEENHHPLSLPALHEAAERAERSGEIDLNQLAAVGSAGGAQPKALIALSRDARIPILAGAGAIPETHEAWLVKFDTSLDGLSGPVEQAYALMARAASIEFPDTRLLETHHDGRLRRNFSVKRFDRDRSERIHHHTLSGLCHLGGGDLSYETFLRVTRRLTLSEQEVWQAFRRAVFNVLASNRDDHGKNHGFLYRGRTWRLGPAYDLTFASPSRQPERGMSLAGERAAADTSHLLKLAESEGLDRRKAAGIMDEVRAAIARWKEFADQAQVPAIRISEIAAVLADSASIRSR